MQIPQNGQTHSNNWSAIANCLSVFDHFVGLALKGLLSKNHSCILVLSHLSEMAGSNTIIAK